MAESFIFVDSNQCIHAFKHHLPRSASLIDISLSEATNGEEILKSMYRGDLHAHLKNIVEMLQGHLPAAGDNLVCAALPDFVGDALAVVLAEALQAQNGRFQRINLPSLSPSAIKAATRIKTGKREIVSQALLNAIAIDKVFDEKARQILHRRQKKDAILGPAAAFALHLLCEQEQNSGRAPEKGKQLIARFQSKGGEIAAVLRKINGEPALVPNKSFAKAIIIDLKEQKFKISRFRKKQVIKRSPAPLTLTKLFVIAEKYLAMPPQKTREIAQALYFPRDIGTKSPSGLISYPVTDSQYVPADELLAAREYILVHYGKEYIPDKALVYATNEDRVGAIRPVHLTKPPKKMKKFLSADEFNLYSLIWNAFLASQMVNAVVEEQHIRITSTEKSRYEFEALNSRLFRRGYLQLYPEAVRENTCIAIEESARGSITQLSGIELRESEKNKELIYTEALLLDALADLETALVETLLYSLEALKKWKFIQTTGGEVNPTTAGRTADSLLFPVLADIINSSYLRRLKKSLIQPPSKTRKKIDPAAELTKLLSTRHITAPASNTRVNKKCPVCGGRMIEKRTDSGSFLACENYPSTCQYIKSIDVHSHRYYGRCEECNSELIVKVGRFGRFLACSRFPKCKVTKPFPIDVRCPLPGCNGEVIERVTAKGRLFYGCSSFPSCKFSSWEKPVNMACAQCGNPYMVIVGEDDNVYQCPKCKNKIQFTANGISSVK